MRTNKKIGYLIMFVGIILVLVCFTNFSYKIISQDKKMDSFLKNQKPISEDLEKKIESYNKRVNIDSTGIIDPFNSEDIQQEDSKLTNGIFGYLEIPKINFKKPIYLGASYENLAKGVAQIDDTSIPVGGKSTRSVLAGHRGWYGDIMLLKIGQLYSGDLVYVHHHGKTLTYKVIGKEIIDPSEWEKLNIVHGKDMLTLLSCDPVYPPFVNRILVNCIRLDNKNSSEKSYVDSKGNKVMNKNLASKTSNLHSNILDYSIIGITILVWIVLFVNIFKLIRDLRRDA